MWEVGKVKFVSVMLIVHFSYIHVLLCSLDLMAAMT